MIVIFLSKYWAKPFEPHKKHQPMNMKIICGKNFSCPKEKKVIKWKRKHFSLSEKSEFIYGITFWLALLNEIHFILTKTQLTKAWFMDKVSNVKTHNLCSPSLLHSFSIQMVFKESKNYFNQTHERESVRERKWNKNYVVAI